MALPVWPATLPSVPLARSYTHGRLLHQPLETEFDHGPPLLRRRTTANTRKVSIELMLTDAQAATADQFHTVTLNGGASRFTMPVYGLSSGMTVRTVQIASGEWALRREGRGWALTATLLIFDA